MKFELRPARRGEIYARALFYGESGQGKTYTALAVAMHLAQLYGLSPEQVAVLDTETVESADRADEGTGSAEKYAGRPCNCNRCHRQGLMIDGFLTMLMAPGSRGPEEFQRALEVCKQADVRVVVIDGITDEWRSLLGFVDGVKARSKGKNDGWGEARPLHNAFVRSILEYPGHVLATCRAKKESRHKKAEDGTGDVLPDQDSNVIYEYDVAVWVRRAHAHVVKTRDDRLENWTQRHAGADLAEALQRWCADPNAGALRELDAEIKRLMVNLPKDLRRKVEEAQAKWSSSARVAKATLERIKAKLAEPVAEKLPAPPPEETEPAPPPARSKPPMPTPAATKGAE